MLLEAFKRCRLFSKLLLENTERLGLISRFARYRHLVSSSQELDNPQIFLLIARYKTDGKKLRSSSWQIDKVCIFIVINNLQGQSDVYLSELSVFLFPLEISPLISEYFFSPDFSVFAALHWPLCSIFSSTGSQSLTSS